VRFRHVLLCAAAAVILAGCGDRNLILNIDVLSYIDPSDRVVPVAAPPGVDATVTVVDNQSVSMLEGLSDVASVQTVTLTMGALAVDSLGSGTVTVRVYLSDEATDPLTTTPVLEQTATLSPGTTDTLSATVDGDARVAELFSRKQMRASITATVHPTDPLSALIGRLVLTRLDAVVICKRSNL
jgi:hypothetical protein